jgi:hypothetical protein
MTAIDLIDSIFSRAQEGVGSNTRRVTQAQLKYLRDLIDADPERGAVVRGTPGSIIWMPKGRHKYVLAEDAHGNKHTLTRLSNIAASETGRLF